MTKLYVGNLPFTATEESVRALFAAHGSVEKVSLITDRDTGRPRGFGFVEMSNVKVVEEMVNLIVGQRAYEAGSKAVQSADEMLQLANNLRR